MKKRKKKNTGLKWVACIACDHEYFIETFEEMPSCPICGSREYEETEFGEYHFDHYEGDHYE